MFEKIILFFTNEKFIQTTIILALLVLVYFLFKGLLEKLLKIQSKRVNIVDIKKINTIRSLCNNIGKYILIFIGILIILNACGVSATTILTSLGVVGVVVGLALQDILKDFISGIFILIENQFSVGDIIEIDSFKGEVIFLGLKSTRIKKYTGEVKIISNRNIIEVINYSKSNSLAIVEVNVAYEEDILKVEDILIKLCDKLKKEIKEVTGDINVLGIERLDNSSVVFKITALTKSMEHFNVQRKLLKEIKLELEKNKIKIPYPQVEVHNGTKL